MINVAIVGGSGYTGGELLRLLLSHPEVQITQVTSQRWAGKAVTKAHPNLRKQTNLKFVNLEGLKPCDVVFLCLPHGESMLNIDRFRSLSSKIIDLSSDFRIKNVGLYAAFYGEEHKDPDLLKEFVFGIPELHREEMKNASFISSAGCNATATILALYPFYKNSLVEPNRTVVEAKVGSSEGGNRENPASHHPERSGSVRSYRPAHHRHAAEMIQELGDTISFSATSIDMVRGILATCHVFLSKDIDEKDIWKIYRDAYGVEPFIRIVKERDGIYRYPEPKLLIGTNYCDIGFEKDPDSNRIVIISALDNLMKGAAGQAVQAFNIMHGFEETAALDFPGLHPI